jgi:hypothetical protein
MDTTRARLEAAVLAGGPRSFYSRQPWQGPLHKRLSPPHRRRTTPLACLVTARFRQGVSPGHLLPDAQADGTGKRSPRRRLQGKTMSLRRTV